MRRITVATILTGLLLISLISNTLAQQSTEASLKKSLQSLEEKLKQYGAVRDFYGTMFPGAQTITRFQYLRSEGCNITYRIHSESISPSVNIEKPSSNKFPFSRTEWSVNLAEVDPIRIEIETQKGWNGGRVIFYIADGTSAIKYRNLGGGYNANLTYSSGGFTISDTSALDVIASDFRQAVRLCRK